MAVPPEIRTFLLTNYILFVCREFFKREKIFANKTGKVLVKISRKGSEEEWMQTE
jgi:hypothetical protein